MTASDYPAPTLFIAGAWRGASDGATIPVVDPATGATIAALPVATRAHVTKYIAQG